MQTTNTVQHNPCGLIHNQMTPRQLDIFTKQVKKSDFILCHRMCDAINDFTAYLLAFSKLELCSMSIACLIILIHYRSVQIWMLSQ